MTFISGQLQFFPTLRREDCYPSVIGRWKHLFMSQIPIYSDGGDSLREVSSLLPVRSSNGSLGGFGSIMRSFNLF